MNRPKKLLGISNAKTIKGEELNYVTGILYMIPDKDLCPYASKGCFKSCLNSAGRGSFSNVKKARLAKREFFKQDPISFMKTLIKNINSLLNSKKVKNGMIPCVRLNGTSDIEYENVKYKGKNIFEIFPNVRFYDYSKNFTRISALKGKWKNYHITYSRSEELENQKMVEPLLKQGVNVAVVFNNIPKTFMGYKVINGDEHDLRFLDEKGVIVGLTAKGKAKKDRSGFVVNYTVDGYQTLTMNDIKLGLVA